MLVYRHWERHGDYWANAEALQQLQTQGTRIAADTATIRTARAQTAEQERSTLIQTLGAMRTNRGSSMVDTKGIGQPYSWKGTGRTVTQSTFTLARFGDHILTGLTWAARQRKIVVKTCVASQRDRFIAWISVFGEHAEEDEQIENIDDFVRTKARVAWNVVLCCSNSASICSLALFLLSQSRVIVQ